MNPYAYQTAGYAVGALSSLAKANFRLHGENTIPKGSLIFVINHFTRIETILLPYLLNRATGKTIWSLADGALFKGGLGTLIEKLGGLSNTNPDRDKLIVKTLLTGEAAWIIFPEGRMVKNKKVYDSSGKNEARFMILSANGLHPPHTGAATLSMRTEFYRKRILMMQEKNPEEAERLKALFGIEDLAPVISTETFIVPVNITYHPMRGKINTANRLAGLLMGDMSDRMVEEITMEGSMLLSGVDVDIRFGPPIRAAGYLKSRAVHADMASMNPIDFDDPIPSRPMLRKTALRIMGRYMSDIYRMTTVNHDHILATLLKYAPGMTIDEKDLVRRAFLALATIDYQKMGIFRHESFHENPISLLTNDPHAKISSLISSFIQLATEKGVITEKNGELVKSFDFNSSHDFHQVRIENPIAVAANEIEPLVELQEKIKTIALQPSLRIQYMIRKHLLDKGLLDFARDYARYAIPGESKPEDVGSPFLLGGKGHGKTGVLLVHGYMAAPLEVRALAEHLSSKGHHVYAVRLTGHGTSPEDLAERKYREWMEAVAEGYAIISNMCEKTAVGGFSFGAGLALDLCTRARDVRGVFAISAPLKLQDFSARLVPAVNLWNSLAGKFRMKSVVRQFVENHPENPHINYTRNPISGVLEMGRLMIALEPRLPGITMPALIIQSNRDPVVNPSGSMKIYKTISSVDKAYYLVNTPRHGIVNGEGSRGIFEMVASFLEHVLGDEPA